MVLGMLFDKRIRYCDIVIGDWFIDYYFDYNNFFFVIGGFGYVFKFVSNIGCEIFRFIECDFLFEFKV